MQQENYFDDWGSPYPVIKVENPLLDAFKCSEATVTVHGASWEEVFMSSKLLFSVLRSLFHSCPREYLCCEFMAFLSTLPCACK
ncbi:hypothetical protein NC652_014918 [Populus alba x Populus x berolinensis]|nr:hypothetical protein NC652_014918 [Populus alba x Populus x berolinensis]